MMLSGTRMLQIVPYTVMDISINDSVIYVIYTQCGYIKMKVF